LVIVFFLAILVKVINLFFGIFSIIIIRVEVESAFEIGRQGSFLRVFLNFLFNNSIVSYENIVFTLLLLLLHFRLL